MKFFLENEGQQCEDDNNPEEVEGVIVQITIWKVDNNVGQKYSIQWLTSNYLCGKAEAKEDDELYEVENIKGCLSDEGGDVKSRRLGVYFLIG